MERKKLKICVLLIATLIVTSGTFAIWVNISPRNTGVVEAKQELTLTSPAFLSSESVMTTTLDQEAGMSIWLNATAQSPLSLSAAQSFLTTSGQIENITSDYIIGSISLQSVGFGSGDYPHCFVTMSGWVVVYYLKDAPIGKIITLQSGWYDNAQLKDNLLHKALTMVCTALEISPTGAQYYHFQHPSATTLEMGIKTASIYSDQITTTYNVKVPSSFTVDEYSWSYYASGYRNHWAIGTTIIYDGQGRAYGGPEITATLLSPDIWHSVIIYAVGSAYSTGTTTVCILLLYH